MKVVFTLSIGYRTASQREEFEFDDDATDEEIEQAWTDWSNNYIDGGWNKVEE